LKATTATNQEFVHENTKGTMLLRASTAPKSEVKQIGFKRWTAPTIPPGSRSS